MTWQKAALGVAMRVPGLYIIDYWWKYEFPKSVPLSLDREEIINCLLTNFVLLHGFLLLLLPMNQVQSLYQHMVSGVPLLITHFLYEHLVKEGLDYEPMRQLSVLLAYVAMAISATCLPHGCYCPLVLPPVVWLLMMRPSGQQFHTSLPALLFYLLSYCYAHLPAAFSCLRITLSLGISHWVTLLTAFWNKVFVPTHFALYWLFLFCAKLSSGAYMVEGAYIWGQEWYFVALATASAVCDSPVNLLATAFAISYASFFFLTCTKKFLEFRLGASVDNPEYEGRTESLIFIILSIQTSLIEQKMPERTGILAIMLFLIFSSILQSMLEITEPVMLSLSASHLRSFPAHLRAFSLALVLFVLPVYLTYAFVHLFIYDFWQITVLSRLVLTAFQDLDLVVVYGLFLYDRAGGWDGLDDAVYFTRATHKVVEFVVAVIFMFTGLSKGKRTVLNIAILMVHCYVNIWQRWQEGWHSYMLRREAVKKSEGLQEATPEMLAKLNDVCSICYSSMESGCCTTPCRHCFHRACLKKWLYIQDKCPLCHKAITLCT